MAIITREEYNNMRLCELSNRMYSALIKALDKRTGGTGKANRVIEKHWKDTLRQFDTGNNFLSVYEIFTIA